MSLDHINNEFQAAMEADLGVEPMARRPGKGFQGNRASEGATNPTQLDDPSARFAEIMFQISKDFVSRGNIRMLRLLTNAKFAVESVLWHHMDTECSDPACLWFQAYQVIPADIRRLMENTLRMTGREN